MSATTYRIATESDLEPMVNLSIAQNFDEVRPDFILDRIKHGVCVVAVHDGVVVGYRYGTRFCGDIFGGENFLVADQHRGRGIGTALSRFMFGVLKQQGYKLDITANSDYYPPVKGAVQNGTWRRPTDFYKRLGYKLIAETDQTRLFLVDLTKIDDN